MKKKTKKNNLRRFVERARKLGAIEAKIIRAGSVITAPWVRMKCQFGCDGYNASPCCPPYTPTPAQMREVIDGYRRGLLVHCHDETHPTKIVIQLEREIFLSGFPKALGLGAGPCLLCRTCEPGVCRKPARARPSMEACGIDVFATARANRCAIDVVRNRSSEGNYYGLILID